MYSQQLLIRLFVDWPAVRESTNLEMVNMRVDFVNAVATQDGVSYDQAAAELDKQWYNVRDDAIRLVNTAMGIARNIYGTINQGRRAGYSGGGQRVGRGPVGSTL